MDEAKTLSIMDQEILVLILSWLFGVLAGWCGKQTAYSLRGKQATNFNTFVIILHMGMLLACVILVSTSETGIGDCSVNLSGNASTLGNQKTSLAVGAVFVGVVIGWHVKMFATEESKCSKHGVCIATYLVTLVALLITFAVMAINCAKRSQ